MLENLVVDSGFFTEHDGFFGEIILTENEIKEAKIDNLRNKLFNQFVDLLVKDHEKLILSDKEFNKKMRLYEYFKSFSEDQKNEWIDFPI